MDCELCRTAGQGGEMTRCQRCGFDTTLPPDVKHFLISLVGFRPGELLEGRYKIDRILGYGGMSVVYKAHDEVLGEEVAIKVINRGRMGDDSKLFTDIRRDVVTTRKLAHHDIVKIYDFHKTDTAGFLTMEYVPGKDVATLISERGRLGEGEVCRIAVQVAEALHYAHTNGVIHCDIKPANLLLAADGRVKIADFGISRVMHEESSGLTGLVVGTPAYMAPEQIRGERPGPRTDMYALGIVMWHCLMGSPPFTRGDISYQHVHEPLPPLTDVSPDLERIIRKAASKAVDDRYPSMAAMAQELQEFLRKTAMAADATLIQTTPPGSDATILQTRPSLAGTVLQTSPPDLAGTILQTRPPAQAGTVLQTPAPALAGTVAQTPAPRAGSTAVQAPPPEPVLKREQSAPSPPAGLASPPSSSTGRMAAVAAVVVLLAGAAAWGLFFQSTGTDISGKTPAGGEVIPPPPPGPPISTNATIPPQPPSEGQPAASSGRVSVGPGAAAGSAGVVVAAGGSGRPERPPATAGQSVAAPGGSSAAIGVAAVSTPLPAVSVAVPVSTPSPGASASALQTSPPETSAPTQQVASSASASTSGVRPQPVAAPAPVFVQVQAPPPVSSAPPPPPVAIAAPTASAQPQTPAPVASAALPQQPAVVASAAPVPPAPTRDLGPPIQTAALQGGRWCDLRVRAVGTGLPMAAARSEGERRLTAERAAILDAYRRLGEHVKGLQVSGGSTVKDFIATDASYGTKMTAFIRGARQVDSQNNGDGTWSAVVEMNLAGMCAIIQAGTP